MKHHFFLIAILLFSSSIYSQTVNRIYSSVIDSVGKPVPDVSVSLLKAKDSSLVKISISDREGVYEFLQVKSDRYILSFSSVGYGSAHFQALEVAGDTVKAPVIILKQTAKGLINVTVQSRRPLVEAQIDKLVVNVDASPTNAGSSALEVLEKSPGVAVDRDGTISLKGKQGVLVFMDGKQTYLSGNDLANFLRNLPSSQIEAIEIMTQPSARYDAAGNAGIINLRTKKIKSIGLNGSLSLSYVQGYLPRSSNSFMVNYRQGKVNLSVNISYAYLGTQTLQVLNRKFKNAQALDTAVFQQENRQSNIRNNLTTRISADYALSKKTTLSFFVNGVLNKNIEEARINGAIYSRGKLSSSLTSQSDNHQTWKNISTNLNLRRILKGNGEISGDLDFINYDFTNNQHSNNYATSTITGPAMPYLVRAVLPSSIQIFSSKVDYSRRLNGGVKFESGVKSSKIRSDNNAPYESFDHALNKWVDDRRKDHFAYEENIYAVYINFNKQFKKVSVQAGLRTEYTSSLGEQVLKDKKINNRYLEFFPTFFTRYAINQQNQWVLSYGRRIDRPNYQDLNPFQSFLDSFTYHQGNPYLSPQYTHNVELTHNYKGKWNTTLNYTNTTHIINDILKQNDTTKVTFQTKENVAQRINIGLAVSYNSTITKWWTTSLYFNLFNNHYQGVINNTRLKKDVVSFSTTMSQQFQFGKGWSGEVTGFYRSPSLATGLFLISRMGVISFGTSKQILKNKGTLKLNVIDPFAIQNNTVTVDYGNIDMLVVNTLYNRRVGVVFTYRFSKGQSSQLQRRNGSALEELNRISQ